jgi:hypothetical protein
MNEVGSTTLSLMHLPPAQPNTAGTMLRLLLYPGELYRLPPAARDVRILAGRAWLTVAVEYIFVSPVEKILSAPIKDSALCSALGHRPLILEIYLVI